MKTLLVAVAAATGCCAVARILLYRLHPGIPGLLHWAWGTVLGAASLLLIALRDGSGAGVALSLAQLLIIAGFALAWQGFRLFQGRRPLASRSILGLAAVAVGVVGISHALDSLALRSVGNSAMIGLISAAIAWELLRSEGEGRMATRFTGWVYGANALFFVLRGGAVFLSPEPLGGATSGGFSALAGLWWLCMVIAITLGMVLMTGERLQADLNRQASLDPLTGALNRRAFAALAQREVARMRRGGGGLALVMMDLDHFKRINDGLGHAVGDDVLSLFARLARQTLRAGDLFCRFGGEEFLALLPGSHAQEAMMVADRLRQAFSKEALALDVDGRLGFAMSLSAGISVLASDEELDQAIRRADAALYRAKEEGRDRCLLAG